MSANDDDDYNGNDYNGYNYHQVALSGFPFAQFSYLDAYISIHVYHSSLQMQINKASVKELVGSERKRILHYVYLFWYSTWLFTLPPN